MKALLTAVRRPFANGVAPEVRPRGNRPASSSGGRITNEPRRPPASPSRSTRGPSRRTIKNPSHGGRDGNRHLAAACSEQQNSKRVWCCFVKAVTRNRRGRRAANQTRTCKNAGGAGSYREVQRSRRAVQQIGNMRGTHNGNASTHVSRRCNRQEKVCRGR